MTQAELEGTRTGTTTAEWKHGAWRVATPGGPDATETHVDLSALPGDVRLVLPRAVQAHLDEAGVQDAAGHVVAAAASRGAAARLLRSKRMGESDIARCLGVSLEAIRPHLPGSSR
ncbi:hypothetical protein [Herbiconiux sp.]|uniref:hypothetical protein n=1 Tax=Herbiconiux sp. TaxID=1871186 RepID=UPI0025BD6982|nr:hypothetical protein [Herbiconiux sp.]